MNETLTVIYLIDSKNAAISKWSWCRCVFQRRTQRMYLWIYL